MKAKEIAKYLPYAPDDVEYKLLTTEEYKSLIFIANQFYNMYNKMRSKDKDIEIAYNYIIGHYVDKTKASHFIDNASTKYKKSKKKVNKL